MKPIINNSFSNVDCSSCIEGRAKYTTTYRVLTEEQDSNEVLVFTVKKRAAMVTRD